MVRCYVCGVYRHHEDDMCACSVCGKDVCDDCVRVTEEPQEDGNWHDFCPKHKPEEVTDDSSSVDSERGSS